MALMIPTDVPDLLPPGAQAWLIDYTDEPQSRHNRFAITSIGPWSVEPDKAQWVDPDTDLDCLIVRGHMGSLCGYVGLPPGHPLHGAEYDDVPVQVHGSLTFAGPCMPGNDEQHWIPAPECLIAHALGEDGWRPTMDGHEHLETLPSPGICHVPLPGRAEAIHWLGFDCGHAFDLQPGLRDWERQHYPQDLQHEDVLPTRYRDFAYVVSEVRALAYQLAQVSA